MTHSRRLRHPQAPPSTQPGSVAPTFPAPGKGRALPTQRCTASANPSSPEPGVPTQAACPSGRSSTASTSEVDGLEAATTSTPDDQAPNDPVESTSTGRPGCSSAAKCVSVEA